jgi:hypothetical protein
VVFAVVRKRGHPGFFKNSFKSRVNGRRFLPPTSMLFTVIRLNLKIFYLAHVLSPIASLQKPTVTAELGNQANPAHTHWLLALHFGVYCRRTQEEGVFEKT